jgi:hypothetical protein
MRSWVFATQAVTLWLIGVYACARPHRAKWVLVTGFSVAVLLPLIVAWVLG